MAKSKYFSDILYAICAVSLLAFLYVDFSDFPVTHFLKISVTLLVFISGYLGSFIRCRFSDKKASQQIMYNTTFFLFVVYSVVVFDFTLIDGVFGRDISFAFSMSKNEFIGYIKNSTNVIPFKTICLFFKGFKSGCLTF